MHVEFRLRTKSAGNFGKSSVCPYIFVSFFSEKDLARRAGFGDDTFRCLSISSCLDWLAMATAKAITPFVVGACYAIRGVFEISTVALMQLVRYVAT